MGTVFETTSWSTILSVQGQDSAVRRTALSRLCEIYWLPLYCYIRQKRFDPEQAQDLTQEFFCQMLERETLEIATPERGRFRHFLLAVLEHFLSDTRRQTSTLKRGGGKAPIVLDFATAEGRYAWDHRPEADPRAVYDRRWAETVLDAAAARLQQEYAAMGKANHFRRLKARLVARDGCDTYEAIGKELGMTSEAVKAAVYRLRRRYAVCLREEIAATLADRTSVEEELHDLFAAAAGWRLQDTSP